MRLRTKSQDKWVTLKDGGKVLVRDLPTSEATRITEKHTTRNVVRGTVVEEFDRIGAHHDLWKFKIRGWAEMKDEDGNDLPFNEENLLAVADNDSDFLNEVEAELTKQNRANRAKEEGLQKD